MCSYSVATAAEYWLPYCWLEGEAVPAVAMVAGAQKGEVVADCWGEEVEGASYPLEVVEDLQGNQNSNKKNFSLSIKSLYRNVTNPHYPCGVREVLGPGSWAEGEVASRGEADHWGWGA